MYIHSDIERESVDTALENVEVFYFGEPYAVGWYYWFCFPGCLPDSDPVGPFDTEDEAIADCRENA